MKNKTPLIVEEEVEKLSKQDILNFRNVLLTHEAQLLEDPVIKQWLELKLVKRENKIHLEYKKKNN